MGIHAASGEPLVDFASELDELFTFEVDGEDGKRVVVKVLSMSSKS